MGKSGYKHEKCTKLSTLILKNFAILNHKIGKIENEIIQKEGITVTQYEVLVELYKQGELKVGKIIENLLATQGNITVVIRNLEKQGLVQRHKNLEDKRSIDVSITEKGIKIVEKIIPKHIERTNNLFNYLAEDEKVVLNDILKKIIISNE